MSKLEYPRCAACGYRIYPNRPAFRAHECGREAEHEPLVMLYRDTIPEMVRVQSEIQARRQR